MPSNNRKEWRKQRINDISNGSGLTDLSLKRSIDVMNSVIEDLTDSINRNSKSSGRLALIVTICTVILAIIAIIDIYIRVFHVGANYP